MRVAGRVMALLLPGLLALPLAVAQPEPAAASFTALPAQIEPPPPRPENVDDKLDSRLRSLLEMPRTAREPLSRVRERLAERREFAALEHAWPADDRLLLQLELEVVDEALLQRLRDSGAEPLFASSRYRQVTVVVDDLAALEALQGVAEVRRVALPDIPVLRAGSVTSRAPQALRADQARIQFDVDGSGLVLGILSDSFARTSAVRNEDTVPAAREAGELRFSNPQLSEDLPSVVRIYADNFAGSPSDEGAAMAELAYDVSPGMGIAFHTVGNSPAAFATAIDELCSQGRAHILVDDVGFLSQPYYQEGLVSRAASRCVQRGIPYFSAAGNGGDFAYRDVFAGFQLEPAQRLLHNWGAAEGREIRFVELEVHRNSRAFVVLQWNQPNETLNRGGGAEIDLDLHAYNADGSWAQSSQERQGDTGAPAGNAREFVILDNRGSSQPRTFLLEVEHVRGNTEHIPQDPDTPLEFRLLFPGGGVSRVYPAPNGPAVWGHPMAEGVISVAAVPWWQAPAFDPGTGRTERIDPQSFTARGGDIPLHFDLEGRFIGGSRRAPTLAAVDGNNNTFFGRDISTQLANNLQLNRFGEPDGHPNFFGTSAAAPNAAAVAALLLQLNPGFTPAQVREILRVTATDVTGLRGATGEDEVTGAGLINAYAALSRQDMEMPAGHDGESAAPAVGAGGGGGGGGGCFIATAAYGSALAPELAVLRAFRDDVLLTSAGGRWLVAHYYRLSPPLATRIEHSPPAAAAVRAVLWPVVTGIREPAASSVALLLGFVGLWGWRRRRAGRQFEPPHRVSARA